MVELQQKYNLKSRDRNITTTQPKKIMSKSKDNETTLPLAETQNVKTKVVGTQIVKTNPTETKATQTDKSKNKEIEIQTRKIDETTRNFNLENEINKIKIPIPLVELEKNPTYRKQIC